MSSAEVAVRRPQGLAGTIPAKLQYAHELAASGLLPQSYRRQPANVLWAVEFADMLRLPPMAAMTGVHVIDGRPSASAALISALVRRAGHKLRVGYDTAKMTGWAEIVRSDDPDFTYRSEWDLDRAVVAELCTIKDGKPFAVDKNGKSLPWRKFFPSMTKARAVTEVARDACEEVLFGLHYTPEELGAEVDEDGTVLGQVVEGQPGDDPWHVHPSPEQEWLAKALEAAPGHANLDAIKADWQTSVRHVHDGKLTREEVVPLQGRLRARIEELKAAEDQVPAEAEVVEGVVIDLDPDDPWHDKIADIACDADGEAVLAELNELLGKDEIDLARYELRAAAVEARLAGLGKRGAEAA